MPKLYPESCRNGDNRRTYKTTVYTSELLIIRQAGKTGIAELLGCLQKRGIKYKPQIPRGHKNRAHPTLLPQMQVTPDNLVKVLFPLCRAEHRSFWRDQPAGERQGSTLQIQPSRPILPNINFHPMLHRRFRLLKN